MSPPSFYRTLHYYEELRYHSVMNAIDIQIKSINWRCKLWIYYEWCSLGLLLKIRWNGDAGDIRMWYIYSKGILDRDEIRRRCSLFVTGWKSTALEKECASGSVPSLIRDDFIAETIIKTAPGILELTLRMSFFNFADFLGHRWSIFDGISVVIWHLRCGLIRRIEKLLYCLWCWICHWNEFKRMKSVMKIMIIMIDMK